MKKYAIANWKMYVGTPAEAKKTFSSIEKAAKKIRGVDTVICPPSIFLPHLVKGYRGKIKFGVQDVFYESKGAWTGAVSAEMAASSGASYAIVGHSERRATGDTNEIVEKKLRAAFRARMTPILCVGERERDKEGAYFAFIEEEIRSAFRVVSKKDARKVLVAYEPIFAIGKTAAEALPPAGVEEMNIFIRKTIASLYDASTAHAVPVLYGGSVEEGNAGALAGVLGINGFLVGHASVRPTEFAHIINALA